MTRYYEDVEVGETTDCGSYEVSKAEIIEFAEKYDPQPFHVDEEAAEESFLGGLVASGWQTAALCMRLKVQQMDEKAIAGARRIDDLRWIRPLRPGDTLSVETEFVEKRPDPEHPSIGRIHSRTTGYNQRDEPIISYVALGLIERREPADG
ncbi:MaoC family dehydratase [Natrinema sp. 74]|uniref:MaoC family dehydratase n=1 Tax=Natrinema sp. 74 TaxID=3384159 RepID=UPI0038D4BF79